MVVYQIDEADPMHPRGLLVAYEENGRVQPVASDFDAFLFGSRGLEYTAVPPFQIPFLESMVLHTEAVLSSPDERSWTHRWLEVLKGQVELRKDGKVIESAIAGTLGSKRKDGRYGFGDDFSKEIIRHLMYQSSIVESHGAVRHAAECFNFYFPQVRRRACPAVAPGGSSDLVAPRPGGHPSPPEASLARRPRGLSDWLSVVPPTLPHRSSTRSSSCSGTASRPARSPRARAAGSGAT